jgi:hypothetical protein
VGVTVIIHDMSTFFLVLLTGPTSGHAPVKRQFTESGKVKTGADEETLAVAIRASRPAKDDIK